MPESITPRACPEGLGLFLHRPIAEGSAVVRVMGVNFILMRIRIRLGFGWHLNWL